MSYQKRLKICTYLHLNKTGLCLIEWNVETVWNAPLLQKQSSLESIRHGISFTVSLLNKWSGFEAWLNGIYLLDWEWSFEMIFCRVKHGMSEWVILGTEQMMTSLFSSNTFTSCNKTSSTIQIINFQIISYLQFW